MVFSSVIFVFAFLPITLVLYYICNLTKKNTFCNIILLLASLVFYGWSGIRPLIVLLCVIFINWFLAIIMEKTNKWKKIILISAIIIDLGNLGYYKYYNFFIDNVNNIYNYLFNSDEMWEYTKVLLPIGISFYTFQIMSYVIDVYRKKELCQKKMSGAA